MKFNDFICFDATVADLKSEDRDEAIKEIVKALDDAGKIQNVNADSIAKAIIKRENEASTGMGKGVAVPHVKHNSVDNIIAAVAKSKKGIDFSALDKQPVFSIILLVSPKDNPDLHLQAMENIFKHLQKEKFRKFLLQSDTKKKIKDLLKEADENPTL